MKLLAVLGLLTSHALCIALGYGMGAFAALVKPVPASELPPFGPANLRTLEPLDREWLESNVPFMGAN